MTRERRRRRRKRERTGPGDIPGMKGRALRCRRSGPAFALLFAYPSPCKGGGGEGREGGEEDGRCCELELMLRLDGRLVCTVGGKGRRGGVQTPCHSLTSV